MIAQLSEIDKLFELLCGPQVFVPPRWSACITPPRSVAQWHCAELADIVSRVLLFIPGDRSFKCYCTLQTQVPWTIIFNTEVHPSTEGADSLFYKDVFVTAQVPMQVTLSIGPNTQHLSLDASRIRHV